MSNIKGNIIAIIGGSGSGKDRFARMLSRLLDVEVLCSYTTRPIRRGEHDGLEHYFVKELFGSSDDVFASTVFGGYEYWTLKKQVENKTIIYVIDEHGLFELIRRNPLMKVYSVNIKRNLFLRLLSGVSLKRILRDLSRETYKIKYDIVISNNGGIGKLFNDVRQCALGVKRKFNI